MASRTYSMKTRVGLLCSVLALIGFACGDGDVFGDGSGNFVGAGGGTGGDSLMVASGVGGNNVSSTVQSTQSSSNALVASVGGGADICAPVEGDPPCAACIRAGCCETLNECVDDTVCNCWIGCVSEGKSNIACAQTCGGTNSVWDGFLICVTDECSSQCG